MRKNEIFNIFDILKTSFLRISIKLISLQNLNETSDITANSENSKKMIKKYRKQHYADYFDR